MRGTEEEVRAYWKRHRIVYRAKGPARQYPCADSCGNQAEDWSQIKDTDGESADHYEPRCRKCHARYDGRGEKVGAILKGRKNPKVSASLVGNSRATGERTPEQRARIREARWGRPGKVEEISRDDKGRFAGQRQAEEELHR